MVTNTEATRASCSSTSTSRSISADLVMMPAGFACSTQTSRQRARQPVRRLQRLVAVGDAAEHDASPCASSSSRTPRAAARRARSLTTILRSKSVPAPRLRYSCDGPRVAVGAGVKAAAVRVDAEREADVRAVVLREDLPRAGPRTPPASPRARPRGTRPRSWPTGWAGSRSAPAASLPCITEHSFSQTRPIDFSIARRSRPPAPDQVVSRPLRDGRPHLQNPTHDSSAWPRCRRTCSRPSTS